MHLTCRKSKTIYKTIVISAISNRSKIVFKIFILTSRNKTVPNGTEFNVNSFFSANQLEFLASYKTFCSENNFKKKKKYVKQTRD